MPFPASITRKSRMRPFLLLLVLLQLGACATRPPADDPEAVAEFEANNDPIEPWNRGVFAVNEAIDKAVLRPAAVVYRTLVIPEVRTGIGNVLGNLRSPVILLNDALQGETARFGDTLGRFLLNSTLGVGGIFDVAGEHFNMPPHTEDFGQTLAVWGVGDGPYLYLPLLGPSGARDLVGFGVDIASNPLTWVGGELWVTLGYIRTGLGFLNARESVIEAIDQVRATSLDPYATFRSAYRQLRLREITNGGQRPEPAAAFGTGIGVGPTINPQEPLTLPDMPAATPPAAPPPPATRPRTTPRRGAPAR
jgi:phospholipid-binding lipoprotein MlaA